MSTKITKQLGAVNRRTFLAAGTAAAASLAVPFRARAQGAGDIRFIHPTPAKLPLWGITYLAEDMGYYKEAGLTVERIALNGGPAAMTALLAGEGNVNISAPGEMLAAVAQGQDISAIEGMTTTDAYTFVVTRAVAEKAGITAESSLDDRKAMLAELKGARFGITAPGSQTDLETRLAMDLVGLDPASDVQIVPMGNIINIISAMSNNGIEGGVLLPPFTQRAIVEIGAVPVLHVATGEVPQAARLQGQVMEARRADLAEHPDLFRALVEADLKAWQLILENPDEASAALHKNRFSDLDEKIWTLVWASQRPTFKTPVIQADGLRAWLETGLVGGKPDPESFPYDEVIDMSFVEAGQQKLGLKF